MILAVFASDLQKEEIAASPFFQKHEVVYSENDSLWTNHKADAFLDFLFEPTAERIGNLARLLPKLVMVNSVIHTLDKIHPSFIRFNAWPGFLKGNELEAAAAEEMKLVSKTFFGEDLIFVRDSPGFVSPRIVSTIINEAFFALEDGVSTINEIDLAMKLGTNYPYGPFEWQDKIGLPNIYSLLTSLSVNDKRYAVSPLLEEKYFEYISSQKN